MLIATLPSFHQLALIHRMINHPLISGVRYNVGAKSATSPREILRRLKSMTDEAGKQFYLDITGRQLRIEMWSIEKYGPCKLNHSLKVDLPAKVAFRHGEIVTLTEVDGNILYMDPEPEVVGAGQSINVIGSNFSVDGYLTEEDQKYLECCMELGINNIMMSFVESESDIHEVVKIVPNARPILKIESRPGLDFVASMSQSILGFSTLMAARDDLYTNIGSSKSDIMAALKMIVGRDPNAICASQLLVSIEHSKNVTLPDISDVVLMDLLGYRNFMLSDGISKKHFDEAMNAWAMVKNILSKE